MNIVSIRNAKWLNEENTIFDCEVIFQEFPNKWMPFAYNQSDKEPHSVWIKDVWLQSNSAEVADYTPPTEEELRQQKTNEVILQRNFLLVDSDKYVLPDRWLMYTEAKQFEWATYRQALRDIPEQEGFPYDVIFPTKPL
jgi:hypothetical protein